MDPKIKKGKLSTEEKYFILENVRIYGPKWSLISKSLDRAAKNIKNFYYSSLKKKLREVIRLLISKNQNEIKKRKLREETKNIFNLIYGYILKRKITYFKINEKLIEEILQIKEKNEKFTSIKKDLFFYTKRISNTNSENSLKSLIKDSLINNKGSSFDVNNFTNDKNLFFPNNKESLDDSFSNFETKYNYIKFNIIEDEIFNLNTNNNNSIIIDMLSKNNEEINNDNIFFNKSWLKQKY